MSKESDVRVDKFYETFTSGVESAEILVDCRPDHLQLPEGEHCTLKVGRIVRQQSQVSVELFKDAKWSPERALIHIVEENPHAHIFPVGSHGSEYDTEQAAIGYALANVDAVCGKWIYLFAHGDLEVTESMEVSV